MLCFKLITVNMLAISIIFVLHCISAEKLSISDPAAAQLATFKSNTLGPIGMLTTTSGEPVENRDAVNTVNSNLLANRYFMNTIGHLVRERIPERIVHAKGTGAFGYFEVINDISNICKAKFLSKVGKKTPLVVRFSLALGEKGTSDASRELRGFAIKFYTEEGNFDLLGISTEAFALKDPVLFAPLVHSAKRNPATNLLDSNMDWDFMTLRPESVFMSLLLFGDRGIPDGYIYMAGFPIHTFQLVNENGEMHFVRWHVLPDAGIRYLTNEEAVRKANEDPDFAARELYNAIENGTFPSWTVSLQILSFDDVKKAKLNVFDPTQVLPQDKYPLQRVGRIVLNRNPLNHFGEVEQLAFTPDNLVPGILGAPDKLFEGRRLAYRDSQFYRLGANFNKITVNCPLQLKPYLYERDGRSPVRDNEKDSPNYYPNSFHGPVPYVDKKRTELVQVLEDDRANNFDQVREFYENEMTEGERNRVVSNMLISLRSVAEFLKQRAVKIFTTIHPDLGNKLYQGLYGNTTQLIKSFGGKLNYY